MLKISWYKFVALDVTQGIKALQLYVQVVIISNEKSFGVIDPETLTLTVNAR